MSGRFEQKAFAERCYNEWATGAGGEAFIERGYNGRRKNDNKIMLSTVIFGVLCSFALGRPDAWYGVGDMTAMTWIRHDRPSDIRR